MAIRPRNFRLVHSLTSKPQYDENDNLVSGRESFTIAIPEALLLWTAISSDAKVLWLTFATVSSRDKSDDWISWWARRKLAMRLGWSLKRLARAHAELVAFNGIQVSRNRRERSTNRVRLGIPDDGWCVTREEKVERENDAYSLLTEEEVELSLSRLPETVTAHRKAKAEKVGRGEFADKFRPRKRKWSTARPREGHSPPAGRAHATEHAPPAGR